MKTISLICCLFILAQASAQEDYTIYIGDSAYKVNLNSKRDVMINGKKVSLSLKLNDTLTYSDDYLSFKYMKDFSISKTKVDEGIEQIMIMTADGSGILIQKYSTINPSMLHELMLSEVTKESINYGFVMTREDYKKTIRSGHNIDIKKAVLKYKDDVNIYEITSVAKKDEGVLLMTVRMDNEPNSNGEKLIKLMWETLRFKQ
ncbi:MAG TPA: hypothetical protein VD993_10320 [Chitinophagaceae bacterium]|nr:hypothetical protein [Chitinophagaceae bacterium]